MKKAHRTILPFFTQCKLPDPSALNIKRVRSFWCGDEYLSPMTSRLIFYTFVIVVSTVFIFHVTAEETNESSALQ